MDNNNKEDNIHNELKTLENKQENIEKILERGSDTVVIQIGSKYIRYGMASDSSPNIIENIICYKANNKNINNTPQKNINNDDNLKTELIELYQTLINKEIFKKINEKIDYKHVNINDIDLKSKKIYEYEFKYEEVLTENVENKNIYFGSDAFPYINNTNYIIRNPIKNGNFNISENYKEEQIINDLELLLAYILEVLLGIERYNCKNYFIMFSFNDNFNRYEWENFIDIFFKRFPFKGFSLNTESILSSYCNSSNASLIVDFAPFQTRVCVVEEGNIIQNTQKIVNFGIEDFDYILYLHLQSRDYKFIDNVYSNKMKDLIEYIRFYIGYFHNEDNIEEEYFYLKFENNIYPINIQDILFPYYIIFYEINCLKKQPLQITIFESLCEVKNNEIKKKAADNIIFTGGISFSKGSDFLIEDYLINHIASVNDDVEQVHMIDLYNEKDIINYDTVWIGLSIIPKIDSFEEFIIYRNKYIGNSNYTDNKRDKIKLFGKELLKEKVPFTW